MVHDFHRDLRDSMGDSGDFRVEEIMRDFYARPPDFFLDWKPREQAYEHDFEVTAFGKIYKWEEKRRKTDYGDELLEDISNDRTGTDGWTRKCRGVDYVLFLYPERHTIWPGPELQHAFTMNRQEWIKHSGYKRAPNPGYNTLNIAVPTKDLRTALSCEGASQCIDCGESVGRFGVKCSNSKCKSKSCCVITDIPEDWLCTSCFH